MNKDRSRLDLLLIKKGIVESRQKARSLIMAGAVFVDGIRIEKPGYSVSMFSKIHIKEDIFPKYVSRGGLKLQAALDYFNIDPIGKIFLDVGASTGGFTDCLLQKGAEKVIAVDVGYGQLHWKLRNNPKVILMERTNIRYLTSEILNENLDGAVIDVSFISLKLVIPVVSQLLKNNSIIIALIKPQFEVGKGKVGKGGVVRDPKLHRKVINDIISFAIDLGWNIKGCFPSPLLGPKGNREFFIYMIR